MPEEIAAFDSCPSGDTPLAVLIERGAIKAAVALNAPRASEVSVYVMRALVQLRDTLIAHKEFAKRLDELEAEI